MVALFDKLILGQLLVLLAADNKVTSSKSHYVTTTSTHSIDNGGQKDNSNNNNNNNNRYPWLEQLTRQEQLTVGCRHALRRSGGRGEGGVGGSGNRITKNRLNHVLVDHQHKLLYCYVPKVACTNWKRVLMVLTGASNVTNLMDIPGYVAHSDNSTVRLSQLTDAEIRRCLDRYTAFLIVRHPFERLLSAFRNKFENTYSQYFQIRYGREIIRKYRPRPSPEELRTGSNVSFREFVRYILTEGAPAMNEHWRPTFDLCHPCSLNYTFIGRYETLVEDSRALLDMVGAPPLALPSTRGSNTSERLRAYFQQLSLFEIQGLYKLYELDFRLFGYNLEDMLGFDLA